MPKVVVEPFSLYGWQAHRFSCGQLRLVLVPQVGGRIISARYDGKEMLYVNRELSGQVYDLSAVSDLAQEKRTHGFRLWGGDKTWVAPQSAWTEGIPPLDLDAGPYALELDGSKAVMTSSVCRETGLQIRRTVEVQEDESVRINEELINRSDAPVARSIWNVTQVPRPCTIYIPAPQGAIRSYHVEDPSLPEVKDIFREHDGWVDIPCEKSQLFKCGGMPSNGQVIIKLPMHHRKELVWLKSFVLDPAAVFAHRSAVEVFNSDRANYAEVELHAPANEILPGSSVTFSQQWQFRKI